MCGGGWLGVWCVRGLCGLLRSFRGCGGCAFSMAVRVLVVVVVRSGWVVAGGVGVSVGGVARLLVVLAGGLFLVGWAMGVVSGVCVHVGTVWLLG